MAAQFFLSILVGLMVSAVMFLPLLVWQYRRLGLFDPVRMIWTVAAFIYTAALVAFTIFPMPSAEQCALVSPGLQLDPLNLPRQLMGVVAEQGLAAAARSWVLWEALLNVLLFVPFGFIARRLMEWRPALIPVAALGVSLLIESTQFTGNWGLAPCTYRFSDVTDLLTNTSGAVVGLVLERLTPRVIRSTSSRRAARDLPRPVTRIRRLTGMVLDAWYLGTVWAVAATTVFGVIAVVHTVSGDAFTEEVSRQTITWMTWAATVTTLAAVVLPALVGTGASLGQRTVYLRPRFPSARWRTRSVLRALSGPGLAVVLLSQGPVGALAALAWSTAVVLSLASDPRGLTCRMTGCGMEDVRAVGPQSADSGTGSAETTRCSGSTDSTDPALAGADPVPEDWNRSRPEATARGITSRT